MARVLITAAVAALLATLNARAGGWTNVWNTEAWAPTGVWYYATAQKDLYDAVMERARVAGVDTNLWENPAGTSIWHDIGFLFDFDARLEGLANQFVDDKSYTIDSYYSGRALNNGQLEAMRKFARTNLCLYAIGKTNFTRAYTTGYTSIWHYASTNDLWERRKAIEALTTLEQTPLVTSTQVWWGPDFWSPQPGNRSIRTERLDTLDPSETNVECNAFSVDSWVFADDYYWKPKSTPSAISSWNYQNTRSYKVFMSVSNYPPDNHYYKNWTCMMGSWGPLSEEDRQIELDQSGYAANDYAISLTNIPLSHIAEVYLCWSTNIFEQPNQTGRYSSVAYQKTANPHYDYDPPYISCNDPPPYWSGPSMYLDGTTPSNVFTNVWAGGLVYANLPLTASNVIDSAYYNATSWTWFDDNCPKKDHFEARIYDNDFSVSGAFASAPDSLQLGTGTAEGRAWIFNKDTSQDTGSGARSATVSVRAYANYDATNGFRYVKQ